MKIDFPPMEAQSVSVLPQGKAWIYEPKWDGFRCLALRNDDGVSLVSKSGKPLNRYFPDIVRLLENIKAPRFLLDGEIVIFNDHGLSFSDLQLRLHPSENRVNKLVAESPASFVLFDLLETPKGEDMRDMTFSKRRNELEKFHAKFAKEKFLQLSPQTPSIKLAQGWLTKMKGTIDGVMAKQIDSQYVPGERVMQKYKPIKTADCVVGGFRYGAGSTLVGSLLLGLYDDKGLLNHVGFTSSIAKQDKPVLTKRLEKLRGGTGFTGKAPGGPSRWSTERTGQWEALKPELIVEVAFDHVSDKRFRHGTKLIRFREDKISSQCKMEQLFQN